MRPNLSVSHIASVLTAIGGAAVVAACGGAPPAAAPANANEITHPGPGVGGQSSCSAKGCGANATSGEGHSSCGAKAAPETPKTGVAPGGAGNATPTPDAKPEAAKDDAKGAVTGAAPAPAPTTTAKPKPAPKKGAGAGQASCGAGTCAADPKKK